MTQSAGLRSFSSIFPRDLPIITHHLALKKTPEDEVRGLDANHIFFPFLMCTARHMLLQLEIETAVWLSRGMR